MENSTLSVGDEIEARCTKCRKNNSHIIVIIGEETPEKVQCNVCERQHKYRPPSVAKKPATRTPVLPGGADRKEWERLRPTMDDAKAKDYSMTDAYKINTLINHNNFGLGVVQRVIGSQKVEILFQTGKKTMRCK